MSTLIRHNVRNALNKGDPITSEALKRPFLAYTGQEYTTIICKRDGLPYSKIQAWLNGCNALSDELQEQVRKLIAAKVAA